MTLRRLNPTSPSAVIDRTDDSGTRQARAAILGESGLFTDVLVDAVHASGITAWWADWTSPDLLDDLHARAADLVVISLGRRGYNGRARRLIQGLAERAVPAIALDETVVPLGSPWVEAGALWAVNPTTADIDELAMTIRSAAEQRDADASDRARAALAEQTWAASIERPADSSILTMHPDAAVEEDSVGGNGIRSWADRSPSSALAEQEREPGRQD